jgi:DNA-binding NtrC family response regulator
MLGSSAAITLLRGQIHRVAPHFRTALLTGERGCGDITAAHILHQLSPRSQYPFRELTPAYAQLRFGSRPMHAPAAGEGMFYLPRPESLSHDVQAALLRLLRERGSQAPRIVAFAERGLRPLVTTSGFSAELADSLEALHITLPSLRERSDDIPELLSRLLQEFATNLQRTPPMLAPDLFDAARKSPWPGNFPQMQAAVQGLIELTGKPVLHAADLRSVLGTVSQPLPLDRSEIRMVSLDTIIQEHIRAILFACNGNKLRAADILGISRSTLYRMLETHAAQTDSTQTMKAQA